MIHAPMYPVTCDRAECDNEELHPASDHAALLESMRRHGWVIDGGVHICIHCIACEARDTWEGKREVDYADQD
jgi:hypothetical protein